MMLGRYEWKSSELLQHVVYKIILTVLQNWMEGKLYGKLICNTVQTVLIMVFHIDVYNKHKGLVYRYTWMNYCITLWLNHYRACEAWCMRKLPGKRTMNITMMRAHDVTCHIIYRSEKIMCRIQSPIWTGVYFTKLILRRFVSVRKYQS